jgi:hypothetical protein
MFDEKISRKDFLKVFGFVVTNIILIRFGGIHFLTNLFSNTDKYLSNKRSQYLASATPVSQARWENGPVTNIIPIHASMLFNGKIFYLAGSGYKNERHNGPFDARLIDINLSSADRIIEESIPLDADLLNAGITQLDNGRIFLVGGTQLYDIDPNNCSKENTSSSKGKWHGLNSVMIFDVDLGSFMSTTTTMSHGRSYPVCMTLNNGNVVIINGLDEYGTVNRLVEVYDNNQGSVNHTFDPNSGYTYCVGNGLENICINAGLSCYGGPRNGVSPYFDNYNMMHLLPTGKIVSVGGSEQNIRLWDPDSGSWTLLGRTAIRRIHGTSFLLPIENNISEKGKVLLVGGSPSANQNGINSSEILDFNRTISLNPISRTQMLQSNRKRMTPVLLPDGNAVIFGGAANSDDSPILFPELFDPISESWNILPSSSIPRTKHHVGLLLPDGRVWVAGGINRENEWELRSEFFIPSYFFEERPIISNSESFIVIDYGGLINIDTLNANNITHASLLRLMNVSNYQDSNQRFIWLGIVEKDVNAVKIAAPINSDIAPPGWYMLHILNEDNIPSKGFMVRIQK